MTSLGHNELTTFEAILHKTGQISVAKILSFASKKMVELDQNGQNLLKIYTIGYGASAKIRHLATEI